MVQSVHVILLRIINCPLWFHGNMNRGLEILGMEDEAMRLERDVCIYQEAADGV